MGQLSGRIAHDLNNQLGVILGCTELLERRYAGDEAVGMVREAADRASELSRHLLAFSGSQIVQPEPLDLDTFLEAVAPELERLLGDGVELVVEHGPGPHVVWAGPSSLEQVLHELCVNAREAMPRGGRVRLRTARQGDACVVSVEDDGVGMDEATLARAFEPLFTTKGSGRLGLGLSSAESLLGQLGGSIEARSDPPGGGARFLVKLPRIKGPARARGAPEGRARPATRAVVLLVEDHDAVRAVVHQMLEGFGHRVIAHADPEAALAWLDEGEPIDVLLTDVVMPRMNGRALADAVRARRPGTRVLYMSGSAGDEALRRGVLGPGATFLHKPFTSGPLLAALEGLLSEDAAS